jgi:transcription factor 1
VAGIPAATLQPCGGANVAPPPALMIRIRPSLPRILWPSSASVRQWTQTRPATYSHGGKAGRPKGAHAYWSEEKLRTSSKYPLSEVMKDTVHPNLEPKGKRRQVPAHGPSPTFGGVHVRPQIVSPDLCGTSRPGGGDICVEPD